MQGEIGRDTESTRVRGPMAARRASAGVVLLLAVLTVAGVVSSVLWGLHLAEVSRAAWIERGRMQALEHSRAVDAALSQVEAQLQALATLFHSSDQVDPDELISAEANLPAEGLSVTLTGLAYVRILDNTERAAHEARTGVAITYPGDPYRRAPDDLSHYPVSLGSRGFPVFHEGADLAALPALRSMALSAERLRREVVMSPTFMLGGRRLIALAVFAPNGGVPGLLIGLLPLESVFSHSLHWHVPGLEVQLLEYPGSWEVDGVAEAVRGGPSPGDSRSVSFEHRFTHGEARWKLDWSLLPHFQGGVNTLSAWTVAIGGSLLSLILGGVLSLLVYQNALIRRRVDERTAELSDALSRAEEGNRAKTNFLAVVGHELRTPLNAVIGFADLLEDNQPNETARSYVRFVQGGGRHLLRLVNSLLEVAQAEAGGLTLAESDICVQDLVTEAVRSIDPSVLAPKVDLRIRVDEELPRIRGDWERLLLVTINLLLNALRAAGDGGRVTVRAGGRPEDGGVRLTVTDTGPGMTDSQVTASLALFEQIESPMNRRHEGLGIGLPLCRHLVHQHGGTLFIDTRPHVGTSVIVDFPAARSLPRDR